MTDWLKKYMIIDINVQLMNMHHNLTEKKTANSVRRGHVHINTNPQVAPKMDYTI